MARTIGETCEKKCMYVRLTCNEIGYVWYFKYFAIMHSQHKPQTINIRYQAKKGYKLNSLSHIGVVYLKCQS